MGIIRIAAHDKKPLTLNEKWEPMQKRGKEERINTLSNGVFRVSEINWQYSMILRILAYECALKVLIDCGLITFSDKIVPCTHHYRAVPRYNTDVVQNMPTEHTNGVGSRGDGMEATRSSDRRQSEGPSEGRAGYWGIPEREFNMKGCEDNQEKRYMASES